MWSNLMDEPGVGFRKCVNLFGRVTLGDRMNSTNILLWPWNLGSMMINLRTLHWSSVMVKITRNCIIIFPSYFKITFTLRFYKINPTHRKSLFTKNIDPCIIKFNSFPDQRSLTIFYMIAILVLLHQNVGGMCPSHSLGSKTWIPIFQKKISTNQSRRSAYPALIGWKIDIPRNFALIGWKIWQMLYVKWW